MEVRLVKETQDIVRKLNGIYQSWAQKINSNQMIRLNRCSVDNVLSLLNELQIRLQKYNKTFCLILNDISNNLFVCHFDGSIRINPYRFGKLEGVLIYLESSDFICDYAKYIITPWEDINSGIRKLLEDSSNAYDRLCYNQVGVLCRELCISLGKKVYKKEMNNREDGEDVGSCDAKGMLSSYIDYMLKGKSNSELRIYANSAIKLADHLTHIKSEDKMNMDALVTAIVALVSVISIIYNENHK